MLCMHALLHVVRVYCERTFIISVQGIRSVRAYSYVCYGHCIISRAAAARVHEEERGGRRRATRPPKAGRRPETNL